MKHRRIRRRLVISAAIALLVTALGGMWATGYMLSQPARARIGAPPHDFAAETVRIRLENGSYEVGWLMRGMKGKGAILLLHPLRGNRSSMVGRARFLLRAGYTVLLVDLPGHGESGGARITFGWRESEGARAALAYLRRVAPGERLGALGSSLGGASLLLGAGEPAANGADAVVLESVYPTIGEAVADRLRIRLGPLGPPFAPLLTLQLRPQLGISAVELRPIDKMRELRVPVLVVAGEADRRTTLAESRRMFAAAPAPKELWVVPRAPHGDLYASAPMEYESRVLAYFSKHLRPAP